ncbi:hypothetical protein D3C87_1367940 [compost metagenome]
MDAPATVLPAPCRHPKGPQPPLPVPRTFSPPLLLPALPMLAALLLATPRLAAHDLTPAAPALPRPEAVARVVMGLLGYARWPVERDALRLCVDPVARYAGKLMEGGALSTGRLVAARQMDPMAGNPAPDCDALYVGAMSAPRREKISADVTGHPVLVIAEEDFECDAGSMFCLNIRERQVSFRVNLDALGRSGIHVHPGVLQLGRRKAPAS